MYIQLATGYDNIVATNIVAPPLFFEVKLLYTKAVCFGACLVSYYMYIYPC